jgi:hypothetical protein
VAPFYYPFFPPFYWGFGWWGPPFDPPYFYGPYESNSSARLQVTPRETEVYVDGYLAGTVDDFDGRSQRLRLDAGQHTIQLYLDGHRFVTQQVVFQPGETYRIRHTMERLAEGEVAPARPTPPPGGAALTQQGWYDAFGRGPGPRGRAPNGQAAAATIAIRVQPGDAAVVIDGERWQGATLNGPLEVQVSPGTHRIEVQKDGYLPFATTVEVHPGETTPLNVSLTRRESLPDFALSVGDAARPVPRELRLAR